MSEPARKKAAPGEYSVPQGVVSVLSAGHSIPADADAIVLVSPFAAPLKADGGLAFLNSVIAEAQSVDTSCRKETTLVINAACPGRRLVVAPVGTLNRDYDDVRRYTDAGKAGLDRAVKAGARKVVVAVVGPEAPHPEVDDAYEHHLEVAVLAALEASYQPLEVREDEALAAKPLLDKLYVFGASEATVQHIAAIETGRTVARDICGTDPERMTAQRAAEYVRATFAGSHVCVNVEDDLAVLAKSYPLLMAVARSSLGVERHQPCVVHLEYVGEGETQSTLFLVGKGITYDTGGADIKAGGNMAGMHRDKGGAAVVAGIFAALNILKPKNIRVVGKLAMVRNSVGSDAYVADEIIKSRAGVRVRVCNTDAEGRMVMADLLCRSKEEALSAVAPKLFTIATLTGHVGRCYGQAYTAICPNGPARAAKVHHVVAHNGHIWADPFEISTVRREDFDFIKSKYSTEDCLQANPGPSTAIGRGHQYPAAFLSVASGLDKHGLDSKAPIPFSHLDIAASVRDWPHHPFASSLTALVASYILPHCK